MICSIHTFELRLEIMTKDIRQVRDWLYSKHIRMDEWYNGTLNVFQYADRGVRIRFVPDKYKPHISFIVNLREVLEPGNLVDLIEPKEVDKALKQVNEIICEFFGNQYNINDLKLCRIDCCVNIQTDSHKAVKTYIKLLNYKSGGKGYKIQNINSPKKFCENGFCAENKKSGIALSIYDKQKQLISINRRSDAEAACRILRVEVQLKRHSTIKKYISGDLTNAEIIGEITHKSSEILSEVLFNVIDRGRYYKLGEAKKIVKSEVKSQKTSKRMIRLLELSSKYHNISYAKEKLFGEDKKFSTREYKKDPLDVQRPWCEPRNAWAQM